MGFQRLICEGQGGALEHVIDDCNRELGRVRGVVLFDSAFDTAALIAKMKSSETSDQQAALSIINSGINDGSIIVIPETAGTFNGGESHSVDGFVEDETRILWNEYALEFRDPSYWQNKDFWAIAENRKWKIAWRTESMLRFAPKVVNIEASDPVEDNLTSTITWNIKATWKSKIKPELLPIGVFADFLGAVNLPECEPVIHHRTQEWGYLYGDIHAQTDLATFIDDKISEFIFPEGEKEVISVLTAGSSAPSSPEADDLYINTDSNKLYKYVSSAWVEQTPSMNVIYVTADTSHVYVWNGTQFNDVTGQPVNGVINFTNWQSDLNPYVTSGYFTAADVRVAPGTYYMLEVKAYKNGNVRQTLSNKDGYYTRSRSYGTWGFWNEYKYAYRSDLLRRANKLDVGIVNDEGSANIDLKPNVYVYYFPERSSNLVLNCDSYSEEGDEVRNYHFTIEVAGTPTININGNEDDGDIIWNGGNPPAFEDGKTYEVDIMVAEGGNLIGVFIELEPPAEE